MSSKERCFFPSSMLREWWSTLRYYCENSRRKSITQKACNVLSALVLSIRLNVLNLPLYLALPLFLLHRCCYIGLASIAWKISEGWVVEFNPQVMTYESVEVQETWSDAGDACIRLGERSRRSIPGDAHRLIECRMHYGSRLTPWIGAPLVPRRPGRHTAAVSSARLPTECEIALDRCGTVSYAFSRHCWPCGRLIEQV
jgi:hypothetical protein